MSELTIVVMAAGNGVRMHSDMPKVLMPVAGLPMLEHVIRACKPLTPSSIYVLTPPGPMLEKVRGAIGDGVTLIEQEHPRGTGHALSVALAEMQTTPRHILVLNGDIPLIQTQTLSRLLERHASSGATLSFLTAEVDLATGNDLGRVQRGTSGMVEAIVESALAKSTDERRKNVEKTEINVGGYCFNWDWVSKSVDRLVPAGSGEIQITDLVSIAREDGLNVDTYQVEDITESLGVNSRRQLSLAETAMQQRLRGYWLDQGITILDEATAYFGVDVQLDPDVTIHPNTTIQGSTRVGRGCEIGPSAQLKDSIISAHCTVGSSILNNATVGEQSTIGPFCHLRPGTNIGEAVHIGSHVEIKNTVIGRRTNVGHFAYLGDAIIGENVNIGAGVITCNFDGKGKHITEIGNGAFIGSDTLLVAPIKVGARAITGAGAVITKEVVSDTTVIGMPARKLRANILASVKGLPVKEG